MLKPFIVFLLTVSLTHTSALGDELTKESDKPTGNLESAVTVTVSANQSAQRLADIKKIFVAPFGSGEGVEIIRDKVINRLLKSELVVVDSANEADAILGGSGQTNSHSGLFFNGSYASTYTRYAAELVVRLTGKGHNILWTDEVKSNWFHKRSSASAGSNAADKLVKDLCKAINMDKEATQISCSNAAGAK